MGLFFLLVIVISLSMIIVDIFLTQKRKAMWNEFFSLRKAIDNMNPNNQVINDKCLNIKTRLDAVKSDIRKIRNG